MNLNKTHIYQLLSCGAALLLFALFISGIFFSCRNDDILPDENGLTLRIGDAPASYVNNSHVFVFNNSTDRYHYEPTNIQRDINNSVLNMEILAGTWNLVVLACDNAILPDIIYPVSNTDRKDALMYTMKSSGEILQDMPEEFRYAYLPNVTIAAGQSQTLTADLERNVGKIRVELKSSTGTDVITNGTNPNAFVRLSNVPDALTWDGGLYPDKNTPQVSTDPMDKLFVFDSAGVADTLSFIVPAHRGVNANDTSMQKLGLEVCMPVNGIRQWGVGKVDIPYVPRPNRIIHINLTFSAGAALDVQVSVKDWEDEKDQNISFGS